MQEKYRAPHYKKESFQTFHTTQIKIL